MVRGGGDHDESCWGKNSGVFFWTRSRGTGIGGISCGKTCVGCCTRKEGATAGCVDFSALLNICLSRLSDWKWSVCRFLVKMCNGFLIALMISFAAINTWLVIVVKGAWQCVGKNWAVAQIRLLQTQAQKIDNIYNAWVPDRCKIPPRRVFHSLNNIWDLHIGGLCIQVKLVVLSCSQKFHVGGNILTPVRRCMMNVKD